MDALANREEGSKFQQKHTKKKKKKGVLVSLLLFHARRLIRSSRLPSYRNLSATATRVLQCTCPVAASR
jgi:hypothetical protein